VRLGLALLVVALLVCAWPAIPARAATITVTNTNDSGPGSLRAAIQQANAGAGGDTIIFSIGGGGLQTIRPTPMDFVRKPVTIDATTQPGFSGVPLIQINGANAPSDVGFTLLGGGITIKGFIINGYSTGINVASSGNTIQGNYLGVDPTGTTAVPNTEGVFVSGVTALDTVGNNLIGGTTAAARNVISGNGGAGVALDGNNGSTVGNNTVIGNYIGVSADGTRLVKNPGLVGSQQVGVAITSSSNNTVGGTAAGARNIISGARIDNNDKGAGVAIDGRTHGATGNVVIGNYIGTDVTGTQPIINNAGVYIDTAKNNRVGGTTAAERNVIGGSNTGGVIIDGSFAGTDGSSATGNVVQGNYIGTDPSGTIPVQSNQAVVGVVGVDISAANSNTIGGTAPGAGNLIAGNPLGGVFIDSVRSTTGTVGTAAGNVVQGNSITCGAPTATVPQCSAVVLTGAVGNTVGGTTAAARNVIGGFNHDGILIINAPNVPGSSSSGNIVQGNFIGTDATGTNPAPNTCQIAGETCYGVRIYGATNNTIGGTAAGAGNTIANGKHAILVQGATEGPATGNTIEGNSIFNNSLFAIRLLGGGNNNQAAPTLTGAVPSSATQITVSCSLTGPAGTGYHVEFFATPGANMPNNVPQGKTLLGSTDIATNGGPTSCTKAVTSAPAGQFVSATATDVGAGNTSPFSNAFAITAGPPASVTANPGTTPQRSVVGMSFAVPLAVTVRDIAGNPLGNVRVTFTAPGAGASGFFPGNVTTTQIQTNASGMASVSFTANNVNGQYRVTAAAAGVGTQAVFDLTNTPSPAPPPRPGIVNGNPAAAPQPPRLSGVDPGAHPGPLPGGGR
jgi:titin